MQPDLFTAETKGANKPPVSRRAVIDKDKLRERYFETMKRLWQKEYTTKYKDLVKEIKELVDAEYAKYEK